MNKFFNTLTNFYSKFFKNEEFKLIDAFNTYLFDNLGQGRFLHMMLEGWAVALAGLVNSIFAVVMFLIISGLAYYKEIKVDRFSDMIDFRWSVYGGLISLLFVLLG